MTIKSYNSSIRRKPEVVKKEDGYMLICSDSMLHSLTRWESFKYSLGLISEEQLEYNFKNAWGCYDD